MPAANTTVETNGSMSAADIEDSLVNREQNIQSMKIVRLAAENKRMQDDASLLRAAGNNGKTLLSPIMARFSLL
jgi:hypothetical protein